MDLRRHKANLGEQRISLKYTKLTMLRSELIRRRLVLLHWQFTAKNEIAAIEREIGAINARIKMIEANTPAQLSTILCDS
jgi:hypothetical protein